MAEAVGLRESTSPAVWGARHLRIAADAAGIALWSWNVDTDEIALDENAHQLWAGPWAQAWLLLKLFHPASTPKTSIA